MKRGWQWPVLVSLALLFTVGVNVVMLFAAGGDPNGTVVEEDYYRKAVEWDRTMARQSASAALGWQWQAQLGAAAAQRPLTVTLRDASGAAIEGAEVTAVLIHNLEARVPLRVALVETAPGTYAAESAALRGGQWEVRLVARRGQARFEGSQRVEAP